MLTFDELHVLDFIADLLENLLRVLTFGFYFFNWNHFDCHVVFSVFVYALVDSAVRSVAEHFILVDYIVIDDFVRL